MLAVLVGHNVHLPGQRQSWVWSSVAISYTRRNVYGNAVCPSGERLRTGSTFLFRQPGTRRHPASITASRRSNEHRSGSRSQKHRADGAQTKLNQIDLDLKDAFVPSQPARLLSVFRSTICFFAMVRISHSYYKRGTEVPTGLAPPELPAEHCTD